MRKGAALIGGILLAASAGNLRAAVSTEAVTAVTLSTTTGLHTSIAIDFRNTVHAVYYDPAAQLVKYTALLNGTSAWTAPVTVGDAASTAHSTTTAMALDATRSPHVVFYDLISHSLKHTKLSGAVWLTDVIESFLSEDPFPSIALAADGSPRVLYNHSESSTTKFASLAGGIWSTFTVVAATMAAPGGIALDSAGRSHFAISVATDALSSSGNVAHDFAYAAETSPGSGVVTGTFFDELASTSSVTGSTFSVAGNVSLALDSGNVAHISMYKEDLQELWYVTGTTSALSFPVVARAGLDAGRSNAIAVDPLGKVHIAASLGAGGLNLYLYDPVSATLSTTTFDASATVGMGNSLVLNGFRHNLVAYMDGAAPGALNFATDANRGLSIAGTAHDSLGAGLTGVTVSLTGNIAGASAVTPGAGTYSFTNLFEGAYTVTPSFPGYGFLPGSLSYAALSASFSSQDFLGGAVNFSQVDNLIDPTQGQSVTMTYSFLGGHVLIEVYGLNGRLVRRLVDEDKAIGAYSVSWDGRNGNGDIVGSGIYLVRVNAGALKKIDKVAVVK